MDMHAPWSSNRTFSDNVNMDIEKAKILGQFVAGFVLLSFILGLLINQPEVPFSMNGIPGEGAFVLMSLPGANLVPHNFYLHSSIVQGIIDPAFLKPHSPLDPCFCLQVQRKLSPHLSNGMLPPTTKPGQGKYTTASTLLELIKEVELAISGRNGRTGTAAGDVAFPKGKENLASVLKRYKQRLSNKPIGTNGGTDSRKIPTLAPYNQ
ncbi:hypothetical protein JHK87_053897 [Glycine soja]|nr:hypothetical protein JHK87_053897 [Glycine soja]